jgi:hypothetical protein
MSIMAGQTGTRRSHQGRVGFVATLTHAMNRLASWRVWLASAVFFGVFAGVFFASSAPFAVPQVQALCGEAPLDVRFTSSAADVEHFLEACGPAGRDAYRNMQVADLVYPLVLGLFMASSLVLVLSRVFPKRASIVGLAAIPLIASGFDYLENIFAWSALLAYPAPATTNSLLGVASAAKTTTFWLAGVLLLLSAGAIGIREGRRRIARRVVPSVGVN